MRNKEITQIIGLSFLTILFFCLSFPPADIGYFAWFAFVPWFLLIMRGRKYVYLASYFVGALFFFSELSWLRYVTYAAWLLLSLYCALYFLCFAFCIRRIVLKLKLPFVFVAPCVWVSLEYIRSHLFSGFPWFFAGHTQYRYLPVIQICDITGVSGISFLIIMVNAYIAWLIAHCFRNNHNEKENIALWVGRKQNFIYLSYILPIPLVIGVLLYGAFWLKNYTPYEGPVVCLVQGNISQEVKAESSEEEEVKTLKKYYDLSLRVKGEPIDLVVWPETMVPGILNINPDITGRKIDYLSQLTAVQLAQELKASLLLGGISLFLFEEDQKYFNSVFFYGRNGEFLDRYDKIHLVPFGEFTPLEKYLPFLSKLVPYSVGLSHGEKSTVFHLTTLQNQGFNFGASICYEDTVPSLIRKLKKQGVDFIFNVTNDGWFHDSAELEQHLAIMVFRAVENRTCMARAANTGISAFVGPGGTIYGKLNDAEGRQKEISGTLVNRIKLVKKSDTFYTLFGEWFSIVCLTGTGGMILSSFFKRLYT
ncbi:MAG: apolipoprotein N-acyltransferase [Candidatus Kuenenia sp.]|nr:apolipoprotein N-acyltransferase [Candidatus Kuenenia hertensis]